jgi:16S rRNA (guanine527-N7)-methyltransferase
LTQPHIEQAILHGLRQRVDPRIRTVLQRSSELGFLGGMAFSQQIDHALGFVWAVEGAMDRSPTAVVDLGTGGGIPGLVLASCWPSASCLLLDSNARRVEFLGAEIEVLGFSDRVRALRVRAEEAGRDEGFREQFDVVTARSFGAPGVTAECASPFLALDGIMIVSEPPEPAESPRWPADGLHQLGLTAAGSVRFLDRYGYQVMVKSELCSDRYPRRVGIPTKRPLF